MGNVEAGSKIRTNGRLSLSPKILTLYRHRIRAVGSPHEAATRFPHIHKAFGELKSWLLVTHRGVTPRYLQQYLDEFVFRFNRREVPMTAFRALLKNLVQCPKATP